MVAAADKAPDVHVAYIMLKHIDVMLCFAEVITHMALQNFKAIALQNF